VAAVRRARLLLYEVSGLTVLIRPMLNALKFVSAGVIGFVKLNAFHIKKIFSSQEER